MIGTLSRRSSTSPHLLGGYRDAREEYQEKFNVTLKGFGLLKGIKVLVGIIILAIFIFFYRYQVHIEVQFFNRNWIKNSVLPTPPLSSQCFSAYNLTLARSPKYIELHAGIGLPLGEDCFNFASTIPSTLLPGMVIPQQLIFHTYWREDLNPLGSRQIALFHSILATQDKDSTSLILWTNSATIPPLKASLDLLSPLIELYGSRFSIRRVDKRTLATGTPLEGHEPLSVEDSKAWLDGDLVRILVLWSVGGVWTDMDTIMTGRDMRLLAENEWVTQWDCYDKIYQPLNGAMMHFFKESPYLCEMLYSMANDPPPRQGTTDGGSFLYHKIFRRLLDHSIPPFKILPYCFTDGYSCRLDNRLPDPFGTKDWSWGEGRMEALEMKVKSIWSVHLHNQWDKDFPSDGWITHLILRKVGNLVETYKALRSQDV